MEELKEMIETLNSNRRVDEETKELMRSLGFEIKKKFFADSYEHGEKDCIELGNSTIFFEDEYLEGEIIVLPKTKVEFYNEFIRVFYKEKEVLEKEKKLLKRIKEN